MRLSYNPPAGAVGHAIAKAFGADPKSEMDQDLLRMKSLLETGKLPHDAAKNVSELPPETTFIRSQDSCRLLGCWREGDSHCAGGAFVFAGGK